MTSAIITCGQEHGYEAVTSKQVEHPPLCVAVTVDVFEAHEALFAALAKRCGLVKILEKRSGSMNPAHVITYWHVLVPDRENEPYLSAAYQIIDRAQLVPDAAAYALLAIMGLHTPEALDAIYHLEGYRGIVRLAHLLIERDLGGWPKS